MDLPMLVESYFPSHGNRQGLGFGWTVTIWLAHILSQADHSMNQVQSWTERQGTVNLNPDQGLKLADNKHYGTIRGIVNLSHFRRITTQNMGNEIPVGRH